MGGGGQLLKSMLAKNIGSVALLLPPFVANFIDKDMAFSRSILLTSCWKRLLFVPSIPSGIGQQLDAT